ncbi:MAG: serine/threonine protein kinase, partial [Bdellovibrionales bacterium]|nr:serine/threonine protein kinase [Bdellovibrionales bacterium]
ALKVLVNDAAFDEHTLKRFQDEMRVCQEIRHPNLVEAYDLIDLGDTVAFSMEYVKGADLGSFFRQGKSLDHDELDWIFQQLLSALQELHDHGIVHRDLKLENVLIREDGVLKLSDLGLMKDLNSKGLTRAGVLLGTAQYMPPEYVKHSKYDQRGDIYATGVMLLELLVGKRRLADKPGMEAIEHLIKTKFEIPALLLEGLPRKYRHIIALATEVDPATRYQTAEAMRGDFQRGKDDFSGTSQVTLKQSVGLLSRGRLLLASAGYPAHSPFSLFLRRVLLVCAALGVGLGALALWQTW